MKKITLIFAFQLIFWNAFSQKISLTILNNKQTIPGAEIIIKNSDPFVIKSQSDKFGKFVSEKLKPDTYTIQVSAFGFKNVSQNIQISETDIDLKIELEKSEIYTDEVIITGIKARQNTPVAFTDIEKTELNKKNIGQDIPYILDLTPSLVSTSDAGTGIGYTSMRIRGTDITRINVTTDGIPINDPESHGVWWVNMPDYVSSVNSVQIQRGVGTSTNGAGAFGANIGFYSNQINENPYAIISADYGSFNSQKYNFSAGTGLIKNMFLFEASTSEIYSDGYIDRAFSDLNSKKISGTFLTKKTSIKLNILQGNEKTYQAWNGVPKDSLTSESGRKYNVYNYENETDNYSQTHYQLFIKHNFSKNLAFNTAFHYTKGKGYYEQYKEYQNFSDYLIENSIVGTDTIFETDLIRQKWLDNDFLGNIYSIYYSNENFDITVGGSANIYEGQHFGKVIWSRFAGNSFINYEYYRNKGLKKDFNEYIKLNYNILTELNIWIDMQLRNVNYEIGGIHDDLRDISQTHKFTFFNPKFGINYKTEKSNYYLSFAKAGREPSRSDFRDAPENKIPQAETLYDFEGGYSFISSNASININLFYMNYKNQLVLTGEINDVGTAIMTNVEQSYRTGIELSGGLKFLKIFNLNANVTISKNKILNFTAFIDDWDTWPVQRTEFYEKTDIAFSPEITSSSELSVEIFKNLNLNFVTKYVGKQFTDNTSNAQRILDSYIVNNFIITYSIKTKHIKKINLHLALNNVFNQRYETNAWVYRYYYNNEYYVLDGYFPQAGFNIFSGISFYFLQ